MLTVREALTRATDQLAANPHLRPTALPDAALLLMHHLGVDRAALIAHPERTLDRETLAAYQHLIARRLAFEPVQYILGSQEFYGLALRVTPAVLIPRPETELLVETVLARVAPDARIVDVGTGSGAIGIALAVHLPKARITALDLSEAALQIAQSNANTHHANIRFLKSDLLAALAGEAPFDAVLSNPPYVCAAEPLHPQVRDFEPALALFAGEDGLAIYKRLIPQAFAHLRPGGLLAMEIGFGQREPLAALLSAWRQVEFLPDLQSTDRVVLAQKP